MTSSVECHVLLVGPISMRLRCWQPPALLIRGTSPAEGAHWGGGGCAAYLVNKWGTLSFLQ